MYARYELVRDENGAPVDAICRECNKAFRFFYDLNPIGKMRSTFLEESNTMIINKMVHILETHTKDVFEYEEENLGNLDVIMEEHWEQKDCVDVYTIRMDKVRELEKKKHTNLVKYQYASMLNNLTIWQWNIKEHKVYADSMHTDAHNNENIDMEKEQLVWDEFDRLDYIYEEDRERFKQLLYKARDQEITSFNFNCNITHNGKHAVCNIRGTVQKYDHDGKPEIIIATSRLVEE